MIAPEHPAYTRLAGQKINGYRIEVAGISTSSDPEEITGNLVESTDQKRADIPFTLDTYPHHISNPASLQKILEEFGRLSGSGQRINFRFA